MQAKTPRSSRGPWTLSILGAITGTCALLLSLARIGDDGILVETPDWLQPLQPTEGSRPTIARESAETMVSQPVEIMTAMLPPKEIASVLQATNQPVSFSATTLINSGIAEEVANAMVKCAEQQARDQHRLAAAGKD